MSRPAEVKRLWRGRPASGRPYPISVQTSLSCADDHWLRVVAKERGLSVSSMVRQILMNFLNGNQEI